MASIAQFRSLALALPHTEEKSHFGAPDFRVRNKIFAELDVEHVSVILKLAPELQRMLMDAKPRAFTPAAGAFGRSGWTRVDLTRIGVAELRALVREAWQRVAPKRVLAALEGASRAAAPARRTTASFQALRKRIK